jgi:iron(III) transport system ATP-binding protein
MHCLRRRVFHFMFTKPLRKVSVVARDLSLRFGSTDVLAGVNFTVDPGEFFALLGPSGSGKTSLLRIVAGLTVHTGGELLIDGHDVSSIPIHQRNVGLVFQNYALWPHLSVWDNVAFGLIEKRLPNTLIRQKVDAMLDMVGLKEYSQRRPATLSGGEQQRTALARTLVVEPQVLLLDEPLSNLDKQLRSQMRQEIRNIQRSLGLTTILVTHDQEEAMTSADRIAVLDGGVLQQIGTPTGLFDFPKNKLVASFLGTTNMVEGVLERVMSDVFIFATPELGRIVIPRLPHASPKLGKTAISFRPHQISMKVNDEHVDATHIWLRGLIEAAEFMGEFFRYRVRVGGLALLVDQAHYLGLDTFPCGAYVRIGIDPMQVRFLAT